MSLGDERERVTAGLRALAHPLRLQMLSLLTGAAMTAAELARELDLTHANASYHLRQLLAAGQIVVDGEERIRGGVAKRYRYVVSTKSSKPDAADPSQLPYRRAAYAAVATELGRRAALARHAPGRGHLTDAELWVPSEVWDEVRDQVNAASEVLHRAAQPPRSPGTMRISASMALFEMEPSA